ELAKPRRECIEAELSLLEDAGVRPEPDDRPGALLLLERAHLLDGAERPAISVLLLPHVSVALDGYDEIGGKRVDAGNTDAVESARNLVGILIELTAGVERGHHDLERRALLLRM